jgi:hypothetical protein
VPTLVLVLENLGPSPAKIETWPMMKVLRPVASRAQSSRDRDRGRSRGSYELPLNEGPYDDMMSLF